MRIAIIAPRYGPDVIGGAESQARGFAEEAAEQGWDIEVWTTCARSHYTWKNHYPAGQERIHDVMVRRFPITHWKPHSQAKINRRLVSERTLSAVQQYAWLESGAHSIPLYEHIANNIATFELMIVLPYAMPLAHYAAWLAPEKVVVIPCLHDEPYAYMEPVRLLLENVWGVMFFTPEEGDLARHRLGLHLPRQAVLGGGITPPLPTVRQKTNNAPTLLYVGRLEEGKNLSLLYNFIWRYADSKKNVRLTVVGDGPLQPPKDPAFNYLGFISEKDKSEIYASSLALCQPSLNESFSMTMMESWLGGQPVIVHEDCSVTRGHVQRSKGGLWFRTYDDFVGAIEWLQANPELAFQMGRNGKEYVRHNYTWNIVVKRFEKIVNTWKKASSSSEIPHGEVQQV